MSGIATNRLKKSYNCVIYLQLQLLLKYPVICRLDLNAQLA